MAARELHLGRHSSQSLLKRERCPGAQPHRRTNEGAIANRLVHRRPPAGMRATSQVEDQALTAPPPRSDSHSPLGGGHAPNGQPQSLAMQAGFAASLPYRRLKQRAQGTAATASVSAVPAVGGTARRRRNRWRCPQRLWREAPYGVRRRRRPGIAGAAGGIFGNIGLYPLGLGPLKCPFSKGFVSGFPIFKSPTTMD